MPFSFTRKNIFEAPKIRVVFMGTPAFAETFLQSIIQAEYNVVSVFTQKDKPQGRNQELQPSPVKMLAQANRIPVEQPQRIDAAAIETMKALKPDLIIVAAYGKILPQELLDIPGFGCINVHPSLLPKYRGASPIQNAIMNSETKTGISIMLMDAGMDTGDILSQREIPILPGEFAEDLEKRLAKNGVDLLLDTLPAWIKQEITPKPQNDEDATICELIEREDGRIFWNTPARKIYDLYRAFQPWPGVFSYWKKSETSQPLRIKFHSFSLLEIDPKMHKHYGEVFLADGKVGIQTGLGIIHPETIQLEGKDAISIEEFIKGYPTFVGSILE